MNLEEIQALARRKRFTVDQANHRLTLPPDTYVNGVYYMTGYLVMDQDSLNIWSLPNLIEVEGFLTRWSPHNCRHCGKCQVDQVKYSLGDFT